MFDAGVTVHDHRQVVLQERAALGHDHDLEFAGGGDDLLALVAARLVVTLDADRAGGLLATQMRSGVVEAVHLDLERTGGAVEDRARRENARRGDQAGPAEFATGEDRVGVV